jgi:hypothetical protein
LPGTFGRAWEVITSTLSSGEPAAAALLMQSGAKTPDIWSIVSGKVFPATNAQATPATAASKTGRLWGRIDKGDVIAIDIMIIPPDCCLIHPLMKLSH